MESILTLDNLITLAMLTLLQAVLGFDNPTIYFIGI